MSVVDRDLERASDEIVLDDLDRLFVDLTTEEFGIDVRDSGLEREVEDVVGPTLHGTVYVRFVKPVVDRIGALVLLVLALPLFVLIATAIMSTMGRGILFRQERVGLGGRRFVVYKFRTMLPDRRARAAAPEWDGIDRRLTHKTLADPRHTPVGRFLRRWSLDELPQLVNVLKGDMSLVGPRPELVHIVNGYRPREHSRHSVRPGLTGLWQTTARSHGPTHLFTNLDLEYVRSVSLLTDLKILLATPLAALGSQKGC